MQQADLDALTALLAKATPGPFRVTINKDGVASALRVCNLLHPSPGNICDNDEIEALAAAIVMAMNLAPAMIERIRELEEAANEWLRIARHYGLERQEGAAVRQARAALEGVKTND